MNLVPALQINNVSFHYGAKKVLDKISFDLPAGAFTGLLGLNGAGKTTLFGLLTRLLHSSQGNISILGNSLASHPGKALAQTGVVFQQSTLDIDLTVRQNLQYHAALHGMGHKQANAAIEQQLDRFNMRDRQTDKIRTLNMGHRRRVEFARALLHEPRLLLLDEATVGLDIDTRYMINQHMRELCQNQGMTILWTSHMIDDVEKGDPVILLHQGRLISQGKIGEMIDRAGHENLQQLMLSLTTQGKP